MSWTNVSKPTGTSYTKINKAPTEIPLYGSAVYGISKYGQVNNYTNISKPTGGITLRKGMKTGRRMPLTNSTNITVNNPWTNINKPT